MGPEASSGPSELSDAASPDRTLLVSPMWTTPINPARHFSSIAAAYNAAASMNPTVSNPIQILVYPGTYPEPVNIVSHVHLVGTGQQRAVNITGTVAWTPGAGVNAPQTNVEERLNVAFVTFEGPVVIDSTAKASNIAAPVFRGCIFIAGMTYNGKGISAVTDILIVFASVLAPGTHSYNNVRHVTFHAVSMLASITFNGSTGFQILGGFSLGILNAEQTGPGRIVGHAIHAGVDVGAGASVVISGSVLNGNVTVAAGGTADVRGTNVNGNAHLVGPGAFNRTTWTGTFGPTTAGANSVVLDPPFPDGAYNATLQLVAGPGNNRATVTDKAGAGFTINDAVGGNTFDYTVAHD